MISIKIIDILKIILILNEPLFEIDITHSYPKRQNF